MATDYRLTAGVAAPAAEPRRPLVMVRSPAITLIRSAAAVLVVLGYLVGLWLDRAGQQPWLLDELRRWVSRPLGLGEDLGPLGLMLLLAAAGYAVPGRKEVAGMVGGVVVTAVAVPLWVASGAWPVPTGDSAPWGPLGDLLAGRPGAPMVPLATAVVLAALGWVWLRGLVRLSRGLRWTAHLAQLVIALCVIAVATVAEPLVPFAVALAFHPLVVVGQVVRGVRLGTLGSGTGLALTLAACAVLVVAARSLPPLSGWWHPLAAVYAIMLFAAATTFAGRVAATIATNHVVRWLADRVWLLLLFSGAFGHPVATVVAAAAPASVAIALGVVVTALAADATYRASARLVAGEART